MKRRDFLKSTFLFAAVSTVAAKATGLLNKAEAAVTWVAAGKLGYKEVSPQAKNGKQCSTCKHYKADAATPGAGACVLPAMKGGYVKEAAYCNMWAKKA